MNMEIIVSSVKPQLTFTSAIDEKKAAAKQLIRELHKERVPEKIVQARVKEIWA